MEMGFNFIDDLFVDTFKKFYGANTIHSSELELNFNHLMSNEDPFNLIQFTNILKTSLLANESYMDFFDRVNLLCCIDDTIRREYFALLLKMCLDRNVVGIDKYAKNSRNLIKEVTSSYYNTPIEFVSDDMCSSVSRLSTPDTHSITSLPQTKSWDEYFYRICCAVGSNSKCFSRKVGAVLVKENIIISTGYNGPPRGIPTCDKRWFLDSVLRGKIDNKEFDPEDVVGKCPRHYLKFKSGEGLEWCVAGHAERNALINAARRGIKTKGAKLYMSCNLSCSPCLVEIINAGIEEIIVSSPSFYDVSGRYLIENSDLKVRLFDFIK